MRHLITQTTALNIKQHTKPTMISNRRGENITVYPCPLISAEKLDTAKGIQNRRKVCQGFTQGDWPAPTLSISAIPITTLIPNALTQIFGLGSK